MSLRTILGQRTPRGGGIARALPVGGRVPFSGPVRGRPQPPISIGGPGGGVAIGRPVAPPTNIGRPPFTPPMGRVRPATDTNELLQGRPVASPVAPPQTNERETGVIGRPVGLPMPKYETGLPQADDIVSALPVGPSIPFTPPTDTNELPTARPIPGPTQGTPAPKPLTFIQQLPPGRPQPPMSIGGPGGGFDDGGGGVGTGLPIDAPIQGPVPGPKAGFPAPKPITSIQQLPPELQKLKEYRQQKEAGSSAFREAFPDAPQMPKYSTMDSRIFKNPFTGEMQTGSSTVMGYLNSLKKYLYANPAAMESYQQNVLAFNEPPPDISSLFRPTLGDQVVAGGTPGFDVTGGNPLAGAPGFSNTGVGTSQPADDTTGMATATGATTGATDPTVTATTTGTTDPMQAQMTQGAIDPVLLNQQASEVLGDPLLRSLYFGTADQPGFFNQLQQAGANLIGSDVPLQQTAGLSPLELLARQQAVAGLGGFEPFLQQNRRLINQAIQQSRRAEALQDPYYSQAEEIFKNTMGAYDPSMTQQFYNPFEDAVVQQTIDDVFEAGEQQDIAARAREIGSGAFGGSRARLGAMERREALGEGLAQALGNIRQRGFSEAQRTGLSEFARQQQARRLAAQGLLGIGTGRGSAAGALAQRLAGFGGQMTDLGRTQEQLRAGQRGELAGFGSIGRGIAETGLQRLYEQQLGQQFRPLQVLAQIAGMLPGYQPGVTTIDSQYGIPTDPTSAGLGAAFSAYSALAPRQGTS